MLDRGNQLQTKMRFFPR